MYLHLFYTNRSKEKIRLSTSPKTCRGMKTRTTTTCRGPWTTTTPPPPPLTCPSARSERWRKFTTHSPTPWGRRPAARTWPKPSKKPTTFPSCSTSSLKWKTWRTLRTWSGCSIVSSTLLCLTKLFCLKFWYLRTTSWKSSAASSTTLSTLNRGSIVSIWRKKWLSRRFFRSLMLSCARKFTRLSSCSTFKTLCCQLLRFLMKICYPLWHL